MIKNIRDLDECELENLRGLYIKYFNKYINSDSSLIISLLERSKSKSYADEMIDRILSEKRIGFVSIVPSINDDEEYINGFITGRTDYEETAWISHLYVLNGKLSYKNKIVLELYKAIVDEFKKCGKTKVATEVRENEYQLLNTLTSLNFSPIKDYGDGVMDYGKSI